MYLQRRNCCFLSLPASQLPEYVFPVSCFISTFCATRSSQPFN